jgi:hypothetical protein
MNKRNQIIQIDAAAHLKTITAAEKQAIEKDIEDFVDEQNGAHFVMKSLLEKLRAKKHRDSLISQYIWEIFPVSIASKKRDYSDLWKSVNK